MTEIIIHVEDFPGNCLQCPLCYDCCACIITGSRIYNAGIDPETGHLPNCPAHVLPEHTGRCIDEDEIKTKMTRRMYACNHNSVEELTYADCIAMVDEADTVIPAPGSDPA